MKFQRAESAFLGLVVRLYRNTIFSACLFVATGLGSPLLAQTPVQAPAQPAATALPNAPSTQISVAGMISGTVKDVTGKPVSAAHVVLVTNNPTVKQETDADADGLYSFASVAPGDFVITITEERLAPEVIAGTLKPGEAYVAADTAMHIATANTVVDVAYTKEELAEQEIKVAEQQRLLGVVPNFFVVYEHDPVSLGTKQKFKLALHGTFDPAIFGMTLFVSAIEQANNNFPDYHQGWASYGKRVGATYGNFASATMLRDAVFPSLLRQDPRYRYQGTGSKKSRLWHALNSTVITKGDNGKTQPNYSSFLGNFGAGAISNTYYPPTHSTFAAQTFVNGAYTTLGVGIGHIIEEFLKSHKSK